MFPHTSINADKYKPTYASTLYISFAFIYTNIIIYFFAFTSPFLQSDRMSPHEFLGYGITGYWPEFPKEWSLLEVDVEAV